MTKETAVNKNINIDWKIDIESFEGPLDLLLHLIKKNNLDIYDIPISYITSEYLKYLEIIKILDLDNVQDIESCREQLKKDKRVLKECINELQDETIHFRGCQLSGVKDMLN